MNSHSSSPPISGDTPIILCLAHLGWDYVWQRPQHLLSRLAQHYPVIYIHEPQLVPASEGEPQLRLVANEGGVTAYEPLYPDRADVLERWRENYVALVQAALAAQGWAGRNGAGGTPAHPLILWFYTPMPVYVLDHLSPDIVVYDVMDQLASFKHAPDNMAEREQRLLTRADLVFTGGRSLYESRRDQHPHVYLFASGVDPDHFAQARLPDTAVAPEIAHLREPVLGYYGVIDERIDLTLLRQVAERRPDWSIVMVGPVTKIEPADLPHLPNIHYVGMQPYERLPHFLKGFDVCLMPFALNAATRYISPTKTLEYMAAHKPIVSTPVPDVVANWSHVVSIAASADQFVARVEQALVETDVERRRRITRQESILAQNTWDYIADAMRALMDEALAVASGTYRRMTGS